MTVHLIPRRRCADTGRFGSRRGIRGQAGLRSCGRASCDAAHRSQRALAQGQRSDRAADVGRDVSRCIRRGLRRRCPQPVKPAACRIGHHPGHAACPNGCGGTAGDATEQQVDVQHRCRVDKQVDTERVTQREVHRRCGFPSGICRRAYPLSGTKRNTAAPAARTAWGWRPCSWWPRSATPVV